MCTRERLASCSGGSRRRKRHSRSGLRLSTRVFQLSPQFGVPLHAGGMRNSKTLVAADTLRSLSLPDVVGLAALAEHLGLATSTVRAHLRNGTIPGRKIGGRWFVSRRDLLAFFEMRPLRMVGADEKGGEA